MSLPSLAFLEALHALHRQGGVTRAARELHLSQSAVSHRLAALERELGVTLLERAGRGVRLTRAGVELAEAVGEARLVLTRAIEAIAPRGDGRTALSISCSPSFAIRFLVPRLSAFRQRHPELDLRIAADDVPVDPSASSVDASVRLAAGPPAPYEAEKLIEELVFPVASPHLLARAPLRHPRDLARHTLLHDEALAHEPRRVGWAAWLRAAGEPRVDAQRGVRFSHAYLAIEAALAGDGVALARRSLVAEDLARGRLVSPLAHTVSSGLSYWLVTGDGAAPALADLRSFLREALRSAAQAADLARAQAGASRKQTRVSVRKPRR